GDLQDGREQTASIAVITRHLKGLRVEPARELRQDYAPTVSVQTADDGLPFAFQLGPIGYLDAEPLLRTWPHRRRQVHSYRSAPDYRIRQHPCNGLQLLEFQRSFVHHPEGSHSGLGRIQAHDRCQLGPQHEAEQRLFAEYRDEVVDHLPYAR